MITRELNRRDFLVLGTGATGALLLGFSRADLRAAEDAGGFRPDAFIRIDKDNTFTFFLPKQEMGQGVNTALPMLLAEEMEVDPARLKVLPAPVGEEYVFPGEQIQGTFSSTSVRHGWEPLRKAGATVRLLMEQAAAKYWNTAVTEVRARDGMVLRGDQRLSYGELITLARQLPLPEPVLKKPDDFRWIGRDLPRFDHGEKLTGKAVFGIDVQEKDLLNGVIVRPPWLEPVAARSFDASGAKQAPGVVAVFAVSSGIAVVAEKYWQALTAAKRVRVTWEQPRQLADTEKAFVAMQAEVGQAPPPLPGEVQAEYRLPTLAHAPMEPMNCTARYSPKGIRVQAPTQVPGMIHQSLCRRYGMAAEQVQVDCTYMGGGFGRRSMVDYAMEAVEVAEPLAGRPVKVIWSREDDMRHGGYRPASWHRIRAVPPDGKGPVTGWHHSFAAPMVLGNLFKKMIPESMPEFLPDFASRLAVKAALLVYGFRGYGAEVEGALHLPYQVDDPDLEYSPYDDGIPPHFWRSVGHSSNAFVVESFMDELAAKAGRDPLEFRLGLLDKDHTRERAVLELVAEKSGWRRQAPAGVVRGLALHTSFGSSVAQVLELKKAANRWRLHRVVSAVDAGMLVNPDIARAQIEGGVIWGLSAALHGRITVKEGGVQQTNFHDYPLVTMAEAPRQEVWFISSREKPGGLGEPGVPPVAAALANAVFAATGKRHRTLPLTI